MDKVRVRYIKTGKAGYISHLDLMTVMQRALIRAGVGLKYSEGFNPHPHISVALPASVGVESVCELLDVELTGGTVPDNINEYLPEGLEVLKTHRPWRNFSEIKWVETEFCLWFDEVPPPELDKMLLGQFAAPSLFVSKKTKGGNTVIDVAPHICDAGIYRNNAGDCVIVKAFVSAQNPTISFRDLASIADSFYNDNNAFNYFSYARMKRIEIFDTNMVLFK